MDATPRSPHHTGLSSLCVDEGGPFFGQDDTGVGFAGVVSEGSEKHGVGTMAKRSLSCSGVWTASLTFWACAALMGTRTLAAGESTGLSTAVTHKVYTPTAISPEAARQHLSKLDLATVSRLPMTNGLLITGTPSGLSRALAVLKVVDVDQAYEVRLAGAEARLAKLPSSDQVAAALGDVQLGSLDVPPSTPGKTAILLDRFQGQTLVVAPAGKMDQVMALLEGRIIAPATPRIVRGQACRSQISTASWRRPPGPSPTFSAQRSLSRMP